MAVQGLFFDGSLDRVLLGSPAELGIYDNDFTIEVRVCPRGTRGAFLSAEPEGAPVANQLMFLGLTEETKPWLVKWGGDLTAPAAVAPDTWYLLSFRFTKSTGKLAIFVDGEQKVEAGGHTGYFGTGNLYLGMSVAAAGPNDVRGLPCHIAEVRVWNLSRSDAEIASGKDAVLAGDEQGLARYMSFGDRPQGALKFDGTSGYVLLPALDIDFSGGLTFEAWVHYTECQSYSRLLDFGNGQASDNIVVANEGTGTNLALFVFQGGAMKQISAVGAIEKNRWIHLAAVVDASGRGHIYKNGQRVASGDLWLPLRKLRGSNFFGKSSWGDPLFKGRMADVRLWNVARTAEQIKGSMNRRLHGDEPGLCGYWKLDEENVLVVRDDSGNGRHGTLNGEAVNVPETLPLTPPRRETVAMGFAGGSYVALPSIPLKLAAGLTCEAWVYLRDNANFAEILSLTDGGTNRIVFTRGAVPAGASAGSAPTFGLHAGAAAIYSQAAVETARWMHLAATVDASGRVTLYKNGTAVAKAQTYGTSLPTGTIQYSGGALGNNFNGLLSDVRVWNVCRPQRDIQLSMRRRLTGKEEGLALYYRLDDVGATIRDSAKDARHGAGVGALAPLRTVLPIEDSIGRISSVAHEGKVLLFACADSGSIKYTVRQAGYETSAVQGTTRVPGWEDFADVPLPDSVDDTSVTEREARQQTRNSDPTQYFLRSRYRTAAFSAIAPVQAVSGAGFLYLFRQSATGTLLCDRFVLDAMTNKLVRKLEVRYKRSGKRFEPQHPSEIQSGLQRNFDSLDFADVNGQPFYEPTIELACISGLHDGWFAPVLIQTHDADHPRWHFFVHRGGSKVDVISIRGGEDGLFDLHDHRSISDGSLLPGIERTTIELPAPVQGLTASRYELQREVISEAGERRLLRTGVRILLAVATPRGTVTLSFGLAADGTLARLTPGSSGQTLLHSEKQEVILPVNSLEDIQSVTVNQALSGPILGMSRGAGDLVSISTSGAAGLVAGDSVRIRGTRSYNDRYTVTRIDDNTIEISAPFTGTEPGVWEKVEPESGASFEGIITGLAKTESGHVRITAANHGLATGDPVQIIDTVALNRTYAVHPGGATSFQLDATWNAGTALNLQRLADRHRRGVQLTSGSCIKVPGAKVPRGNQAYTIEAWIRPSEMRSCRIVSWGKQGTQNQLTMLGMTSTGLLHNWFQNDMGCDTGDLSNAWHHVAAVYDPVEQKRRTYVDGTLRCIDLVSPGTHQVPADADNFTIGMDGSESFLGAIAEVRIWNVARSQVQLQAGQYSLLSGNEAGLVAYYRLGGIVEGGTRTVLDFSGSGKPGTVIGNACLSNVQLTKTVGANYRNSDLIAAVEGGSYEESFEVRAVQGMLPTLAFCPWFKASRDSLTPDVTLDPIAATVSPLPGDTVGWKRVSCQYQVPAGMSLVRVFDVKEMGDVAWTQLELRNHRLSLLPSAVSEGWSVVSPAFSSAPAYTSHVPALSALGALEARACSLLAEKQILTEKKNSTGNSTRITELKTLIAEVEAQLVQYRAERAQIDANYLRNVCKYTAIHSGLAVGVREGRLEQSASYGGAAQQFYAVPTSVAGNYKLHSMSDPSKLITVQTSPLGELNTVSLEGALGGDDPRQLFSFGVPEHENSSLSVSGSVWCLRSLHGHVLDVYHAKSDPGTQLVYAEGNDGNHQRFRVEYVADSERTQFVKSIIAAREATLYTYQVELNSRQAVEDNLATLRPSWTSRISAINDTDLPAIRTLEQSIHTDLLGKLSAQRLAPPSWPLSPLATDARQLAVEGAAPSRSTGGATDLVFLVRRRGRAELLRQCGPAAPGPLRCQRGQQRQAFLPPRVPRQPRILDERGLRDTTESTGSARRLHAGSLVLQSAAGERHALCGPSRRLRTRARRQAPGLQCHGG